MFTVGIDMGGTFTDGYVTAGCGRWCARCRRRTSTSASRWSAACAVPPRTSRLKLEKFLADVDLLRIATTIGTMIVEGTGNGQCDR